MSRITKQIATNVAKKLLYNRVEAFKKKKEELSLWLAELQLANIPDEIKNLPDNCKAFIAFTNSINVKGTGVANYKMATNYSLKKLYYYHPLANYITLNDEDAAKYVTIWNELETESEALTKGQKTLESSILALKTYKKAEELFPEAYALLPDSESYNLPVVNIEALRSIIKSE